MTEANIKKVLILNLNFLYVESWKLFLKNGTFRPSFLSILKCLSEDESLVSDNETDALSKEVNHKILMLYAIYLYASYLRTSKIEYLIKIKEKMFSDRNEKFLPYSQLTKLRIICLKKMANLVINGECGELSLGFESFILRQKLIDSLDLYKMYSNEVLYKDLCDMLKNDKYAKQKSTLVQIAQCFPEDETIEPTEANAMSNMSKMFLEYLDMNTNFDSPSNDNDHQNDQFIFRTPDNRHTRPTPKSHQNDHGAINNHSPEREIIRTTAAATRQSLSYNLRSGFANNKPKRRRSLESYFSDDDDKPSKSDRQLRSCSKRRNNQKPSNSHSTNSSIRIRRGRDRCNRLYDYDPNDLYDAGETDNEEDFDQNWTPSKHITKTKATPDSRYEYKLNQLSCKEENSREKEDQLRRRSKRVCKNVNYSESNNELFYLGTTYQDI